MAKYIQLGEKANFFHDPYTGLTLAKGETKELTNVQFSSKRVRAALSQGHLAYAEAPDANTAEKAEVTVDLEATVKKYEDLLPKFVKDEVVNVEGLSRKFSLGEVKALAEHFEIEVEENDTKVSILKAITE